ncbi:uncharacterized protein B0H18DRAFT_1025690 [Fomitopsis serialis]|uniref:uncharacterized protein n=1 Tax=Fomitopsis serialis TaxID=139415 RepID=UPI002008DB20|nr:uncharacterized protein B0H18DRAFT_1025690 [Neoantrodia serialis]KAH9920055.1 hypothetical protein B0H18DRAFT_1025690 [Neoantrodia serialis]
MSSTTVEALSSSLSSALRDLRSFASSVNSPLAFVVPILVILLRVAYVQVRHIHEERSAKKRDMSYTVKWGRERLHFPLPAPDAKLAEIRHEIATYTQLDPQSFKLVHAGAVMRDDNAPISAYGIKLNSTIAVVGSGDVPPTSKRHKHKEKPAERTEASTVAQIRGELDAVRLTLKPDVEAFLTTLDPPAAVPGPKTTQLGGRNTDIELEHRRLGELLLQSLLRLDAITAEGEWEEARKERKGAVKEVQGLLDHLDGGWRARPRAKAQSET